MNQARAFDIRLGARERKLKPATSPYRHYPIVAFDGHNLMTEDGELVSFVDYFGGPHEASIVVTVDPTTVKWHLDTYFPGHRFRITAPKGRVKGGPSRTQSYLLNFDTTPKHQRRSIVWFPEGMDPTLRRRVNKGSSLVQLMEFGLDFRSWLQENNLPVNPRLTGVSARLFKDSRFWPEGKAIVPRFINSIGRDHLPGGYVRTFVTTPSTVTYPLVACFDQNSGYHTAAATEQLPDATEVFARGFFYDDDTKPFIHAGDRLDRFLASQVGLVKVKLANPPDGRVRFYPEKLNNCFSPERYTELQGITYLWTNELPAVYAAGCEIEYLIAAWTSPIHDIGYQHYSEFALRELSKADKDRRMWLKPLLHMAHGMGGAKPTAMRYGLQPEHPGGIDAGYWLNGMPVPVKEISGAERQIPFTNTLALGILQASVLRKTYQFANLLDGQGYKILHTHTDAVHIDATELDYAPETPDGWKIEAYTNVVYENQSWFRSDQKICHPGQRFGSQ